MGDLKKNRTRHQTFTDAHDAAVRILNEKPVLVSIGFNRKKMFGSVANRFWGSGAPH
jgi:hypothetical protein